MARTSRKRQHDDAPIATEFGTIWRVAGYIRQSSDDKRKPGDTLTNQRYLIQNFLEDNPEIELHDFYIDNGKTGTNFDRPAFKQMMQDIESGKVNCIIVKDLSRFGRNAIDAGYYLERYFPSKNVRFIAINDDYDSIDTSSQNIMLPISNIMNEEYARDIGRKVKDVHRQNMLDGLFIGSYAPYGYKKSPENCHKLIIDLETAPIVRRIFEQVLSGINVIGITQKLNAERVITPSRYKQSIGKYTHEKLVGREQWAISTVKSIIDDAVYMGDLVQGKTKRAGKKQPRVPKEEWIEVKNTHEAIVSREDFAKVHEILSNSKQKLASEKTIRTPYNESIFIGKIFCGHCGRAMSRHRINSKNYSTYWYYCQTQSLISKSACVQVSIKEEALKAEVFTILQFYARLFTGCYINLRAYYAPKRIAEINAALHSLLPDMDMSERFLKSLYENLVSGLITQDEYAEMKSEYETQSAELKQKSAELREQKWELESQIVDYKDMSDAVSDMKCCYDLTSEIIDKLIDKILVWHDKRIEIRFTFTDEIHKAKGELSVCSNV
jgi:Site-specific recombinases, DNA invertase Pin homologs